MSHFILGGDRVLATALWAFGGEEPSVVGYALSHNTAGKTIALSMEQISNGPTGEGPLFLRRARVSLTRDTHTLNPGDLVYASNVPDELDVDKVGAEQVARQVETAAAALLDLCVAPGRRAPVARLMPSVFFHPVLVDTYNLLPRLPKAA